VWCKIKLHHTEVFHYGKKTQSSRKETRRRVKIRELLQMRNITSMDDTQNIFKDTIAEFMDSPNEWRGQRPD